MMLLMTKRSKTKFRRGGGGPTTGRNVLDEIWSSYLVRLEDLPPYFEFSMFSFSVNIP